MNQSVNRVNQSRCAASAFALSHDAFVSEPMNKLKELLKPSLKQWEDNVGRVVQQCGRAD